MAMLSRLLTEILELNSPSRGMMDNDSISISKSLTSELQDKFPIMRALELCWAAELNIISMFVGVFAAIWLGLMATSLPSVDTRLFSITQLVVVSAVNVMVSFSKVVIAWSGKSTLNWLLHEFFLKTIST